MNDAFTEYIECKINEEITKRDKAAEAYKNRENNEDAYHLCEWHHRQGRLQGYEDSLVQYRLTKASESAGGVVSIPLGDIHARRKERAKDVSAPNGKAFPAPEKPLCENCGRTESEHGPMKGSPYINTKYCRGSSNLYEPEKPSQRIGGITLGHPQNWSKPKRKVK